MADTPTKAEMDEGRKLLLQIAGEGVLFEPHANPEYLRAYRIVNGMKHDLVYRAGSADVVPKWDNQSQFWKAQDSPSFDVVYKWVCRVWRT